MTMSCSTTRLASSRSLASSACVAPAIASPTRAKICTVCGSQVFAQSSERHVRRLLGPRRVERADSSPKVTAGVTSRSLGWNVSDEGENVVAVLSGGHRPRPGRGRGVGGRGRRARSDDATTLPRCAADLAVRDSRARRARATRSRTAAHRTRAALDEHGRALRESVESRARTKRSEQFNQSQEQVMQRARDDARSHAEAARRSAGRVQAQPGRLRQAARRCAGRGEEPAPTNCSPNSDDARTRRVGSINCSVEATTAAAGARSNSPTCSKPRGCAKASTTSCRSPRRASRAVRSAPTASSICPTVRASRSTPSFPSTRSKPSLATDDADERRSASRRSTRKDLRAHVKTLREKAYWEAISPAPEFVACFVPSDVAVSAAFDADPELLDLRRQRTGRSSSVRRIFCRCSGRSRWSCSQQSPRGERRRDLQGRRDDLRADSARSPNRWRRWARRSTPR